MRSTIRQPGPTAAPTTLEKPTRSSLAYYALVFFSLMYFVRPEDFIPGLDIIPFGKIAGGTALLALIFVVPSSRRNKVPIELKVLLLLLGQMILCIPFAFWRSGALDTVVNKFSKGVIVAFLIYMVATSLNEVRRLLTIQAGTVALITIASVLVHRTELGRLMGIQKGILENPNDLAINVAINFPLCVAFFFAAKKIGSKAFWSISLIFMVWAVIATYSRSGLLAMVVSVLICLWEFGVKGKRPIVMVSAVFVGMVAVGVIAVTPNYLIRVESIFRGNIQGSGDRNSREARKELLIDSLTIMASHPIFGIGPGNLPSYTLTWRVAHNTYAELGAETGIPGFLLFVLLLGLALRKIKRIRKLPGYDASEDIRLWTSGLWAAMAAYSAGALFSSTEYNLFPYFMVGYVCAVYQIASVPQGATEPRQQSEGDKLANRIRRRRELVWTR
ncbi:MAG: O-antigen ligase family protein [Candidatus Sulfotelmatobacter sp.]